MKLKLKLILSSMFFCSLIFAQGHSPNFQYRSDRVQNVNKKATKKIEQNKSKSKIQFDEVKIVESQFEYNEELQNKRNAILKSGLKKVQLKSTDNNSIVVKDMKKSVVRNTLPKKKESPKPNLKITSKLRH